MTGVMTRLPALLICATVISCARQPEVPAEVEKRPVSVILAVPGALNRMPSLASSGNRAVAVWTSTQKDVMNVYAAVSADGGATFSEPRRVNDVAGDASSNAEQPPRVAISGSTVTVVWPSRLSGTSAIRWSRSTDSGVTFSPAATLHDPSIKGARGWHSIAAGRDGAVHVVWLDGRDAVPAAPGRARPRHGVSGHAGHGSGGAHGGAPRQDVYEAVIAPDGAIAESHVARDVCFCCKTAVGVGSTGRVNVVWRHIFPESMRDIAMATSADGGRTFSPLARVSEDQWRLSGCPDDGPAMAMGAGDSAHLVWPTLVNEPMPRKAIFYTITTDGRSFTPRTRLSGDEQEDAGHPQIAADAAGNVAAVWDEQQGDARRIVMRLAKAGRGFDGPRVLNNQSSAFHPHIVAAETGFLVAWPEQTGETSVVMVRRVDRP
ncbi:MAG TPA: hypothetical protein VJM31_03125 [Vicinamibacterales bacterium]|nr:hypothetical protein [Vicinamibacterales bacterium]